MSSQKTKQILLLGLWALTVLWLYLPKAIINPAYPSAGDYRKFHLSGLRVLAGDSPYWLPGEIPHASAGCTTHEANRSDTARPSKAKYTCEHPNLNPPFFVALTAPLSSLPLDRALQFWQLASLAAGLAAVVVTVQALTPQDKTGRRGVTIAFASLALFSYFPSYANFELAQVAFFLALMMVLAWSAMRIGKVGAGGAWLGVLAAVKPFFLIAVPFLLAGRLWRALASFTAVYAIAAAIGLGALGGQAYIDYARTLLTVDWLGNNWNASTAGFFHRLFTSTENHPLLEAPLLAKALALGLNSTLALVALVLFRRLDNNRPEPRIDFLFCLMPPLMMLVSPLGWLYYFPLLLLTLLLVWRHTDSLRSSRILRLGLICAFSIHLVPSLHTSPRDMSDVSYWLWEGPRYFYTLLLIISIAFILAREKTTELHTAHL